MINYSHRETGRSRRIQRGKGAAEAHAAGLKYRSVGTQMERDEIIRDLHGQIESLTRLHIQHGLHHTAGFQRHKESISEYVREHKINVRAELDPLAFMLYRRYFD